MDYGQQQMDAAAQQQQQQGGVPQQVGAYYGGGPGCAPAGHQSFGAGFHFGFPGWSQRCASTPTYQVPCPEKQVYACPPQPCAPQQVCDQQPSAEQIGSEMQQQQQQQGVAGYAQGQQQQQQQMTPEEMAAYQQQAAAYAQQQMAYQQQVQAQYGGGYGMPAMQAQNKEAQESLTLDLTHKENRTTRRFLIQIIGSCAAFQKNPRLAQWLLRNEEILKRKAIAKLGAERLGKLDKAVILDGRVLWTRSTAPKTLVANCSAFRGNTYTNGNIRGFVAIPPGKQSYAGEDGRGLRVMRPNVMVRSTLMSAYGHLDEDMLRDPLTKVKGTKHYMVPRNHEIMRIIALNSGKLGLDLSSYQSMCGDQYPVTEPLVESCIRQIKQQVLDLKPWSDLRRGQFAIELFPADGIKGQNNWASIDSIAGIGRGYSKEICDAHLTTPFVVEIYLALTYAIADKVFVGKKLSDAGSKAGAM